LDAGFQRYKIIDLIESGKLHGHNKNHLSDRVIKFQPVYIAELDRIYLHHYDGAAMKKERTQITAPSLLI
jgi:hypothetical protein